VTRCWMDYHPSRLVQRDQILVLKDDLKGDIFWDQDSWLGWWNSDLDFGLFLHHVAILRYRDAIHIDTACFNK